MTQIWPVKLFQKSVLKQRKFKEVTDMLGPTDGLRCLDVGSDNGVISYLLRQRGGCWTSADLDQPAVAAIRALVDKEVYQIDDTQVPFAENAFDRVAIVDFLEHIHNDRYFVAELYRILRPGGELIVNVPHEKNTLLRRVRLAIGQTDEKHGHVRPGYTPNSLKELLGDKFKIEAQRTYSKFFSELIDTIIVQAVYTLQKSKQSHSQKGALVTGQDLQKNKSMFHIYSLIYPVVWLFSKLDNLLFFSSGYMLIVKARVTK